MIGSHTPQTSICNLLCRACLLLTSFSGQRQPILHSLGAYLVHCTSSYILMPLVHWTSSCIPMSTEVGMCAQILCIAIVLCNVRMSVEPQASHIQFGLQMPFFHDLIHDWQTCTVIPFHLFGWWHFATLWHISFMWLLAFTRHVAHSNWLSKTLILHGAPNRFICIFIYFDLLNNPVQRKPAYVIIACKLISVVRWYFLQSLKNSQPAMDDMV